MWVKFEMDLNLGHSLSVPTCEFVFWQLNQIYHVKSDHFCMLRREILLDGLEYLVIYFHLITNLSLPIGFGCAQYLVTHRKIFHEGTHDQFIYQVHDFDILDIDLLSTTPPICQFQLSYCHTHHTISSSIFEILHNPCVISN